MLLAPAYPAKISTCELLTLQARIHFSNVLDVVTKTGMAEPITGPVSLLVMEGDSLYSQSQNTNIVSLNIEGQRTAQSSLQVRD